MAGRSKPSAAPNAKKELSSSHHLADTNPELSALEYSLTLVGSAYQRWIVRCMTASGMPQLSPTEILILHFVRSLDKPKSFMDIMLVRDIDETHLVTYAVRKLERLGLVATKRAGKEKLVQATPAGIKLCAKYKNLREELLLFIAKNANREELSKAAEVLAGLAGFYSQATRAAATM